MVRNPENFQLGVAGGSEYFSIPVVALGAMYSSHIACGRKANGGALAWDCFGRTTGETPPPFDPKSKIAFREGVGVLEEILAILGEETTKNYMFLTSHYLKSRGTSSGQSFQLGLLVVEQILRERKTFKEIAELDEAVKITACPKGSFRLRNIIERDFYLWLNSFHCLMPEVPLRVPLGFQDSYIYKLGETRAKNAFERTVAALFMANVLLAPDNYQILIGSGIGSLRIMTWVACLLAEEEELFKKIGYSPALSDRREIQNFRRLVSVLPRSALSVLTEKIALAKSGSGKTSFFKRAFTSADEALGFVDKQAGQDSLCHFVANAKGGIGSHFMSVSDEAILTSTEAETKGEEPRLYPLDAMRLIWAMATAKKPFYAPDVRDVLKSMDGGGKKV